MFTRFAFLLLISASLSISVAAQDETADENPLAILSGFVGTTWKADVTPEGSTKQVHDISRWSWILGGKAIRIQHALDDGSYSGESLVTWDHRANTIAYFYASAGDFYTQGSMRADQVFYDALETVSGDAGGIVAIRSTGELLEDGTLRVISDTRTRQGWSQPDTTIYHPAPDTELVFQSQH